MNEAEYKVGANALRRAGWRNVSRTVQFVRGMEKFSLTAETIGSRAFQRAIGISGPLPSKSSLERQPEGNTEVSGGNAQPINTEALRAERAQLSREIGQRIERARQIGELLELGSSQQIEALPELIAAVKNLLKYLADKQDLSIEEDILHRDLWHALVKAGVKL